MSAIVRSSSPSNDLCSFGSSSCASFSGGWAVYGTGSPGTSDPWRPPANRSSEMRIFWNAPAILPPRPRREQG